jgi:D-hydroxyproline dehydrogenase subunit gamma
MIAAIGDEPAGMVQLSRRKVLTDVQVSLTVNGKPVQVSAGTSVAAAMMMAGEPCRLSVEGEARAPLCGMGICMECRVTVNGIPHRRSCQLICTPGMEVESG